MYNAFKMQYYLIIRDIVKSPTENLKNHLIKKHGTESKCANDLLMIFFRKSESNIIYSKIKKIQ